MTIMYVDKAHIDEGLEWGQMWHLAIASPEMQDYGNASAASVKRVLVARRRWRGSREQGYVFRYFVRLADRQYKPTEYMTVIEGQYSARQSIFLREVDAWQAYVAWLTRHLDQKREHLRVGEQMLAEAEGIVRMKQGES